jgi:hypothetical protein
MVAVGYVEVGGTLRSRRELVGERGRPNALESSGYLLLSQKSTGCLQHACIAAWIDSQSLQQCTDSIHDFSVNFTNCVCCVNLDDFRPQFSGLV